MTMMMMNNKSRTAIAVGVITIGGLLALTMIYKNNNKKREKYTEEELLQEEEAEHYPGFKDAIERVKKLNVSETETQLRLYGLYKRALFGLCSEKDKPWEPIARAKWNAWHDCRDISQEEAIITYIDMVNTLLEVSNSSSSSSSGNKKKISMGPKISKMVPMDDAAAPLVEFKDSKYFDDIRDDFSKLPVLLKEHPHLISTRDEEDRTLLHWAVDSDCFEAVFLLVERGAEIDAKDSDGLTPLGYAASSDLADIAVFLVSSGANVNQACPDKSAFELTRDESLREKLKM